MEDGLSQAFFATICDTVKGIGAASGTLHPVRHRALFLCLIVRLVYQAWRPGQAVDAKKCKKAKIGDGGLTFGPGGVDCLHNEKHVMETGSEG